MKRGATNARQSEADPIPARVKSTKALIMSKYGAPWLAVVIFAAPSFLVAQGDTAASAPVGQDGVRSVTPVIKPDRRARADGAAEPAAEKQEQRLLVHDPLSSAAPVSGERTKKTVGGEYSPRGWKAAKKGDMLVIELAEADSLEGTLEVDVSDLDWKTANGTAGGKAHFINMFSNPKGDHHRQHGGTGEDALWTIRGGSKIATPELRYGDSFKVLWASRGAKGCEGNDYDEAVATLPANWAWQRDLTYTFRVTWSNSERTLRVFINGQKALEAPWQNQVSPLRYIFLAKAADFNSWTGPTFSNLRIHGPSSRFPTRRPIDPPAPVPKSP